MRKLKLFLACLLMAVLSIGQVWATDIVIDLDLSKAATYPSGFPTASGTKTGTYTLGGYDFSFSCNDAFYFSTSYLMIGKSSKTVSSYITFPAIEDYKLTEVKLTASSGTSTNVAASIQDGSGNVLTGGTGWAFVQSGNNTWTLTETSANTAYKVCIYKNNTNKSTYNAQVAGLKLTYTPTGTEPSCSNTVTISKVTPVNGDFEISATEVCGDGDGGEVTISNIEPATGYTLDEVSVTVGTYSALTGKVTGITANTEITVTFKALPKYTVSFNVGGSAASQSPIEEASAGAGITLPAGPTPTCSADGWEFAGWKETSGVAEETTTAPTLLAAASSYHPTANCTLFAVYKRTEGGGSGAAVNTILWSEDWTGAANNSTPASPTSDGSSVYGSATVGYAWTDGSTTTCVKLDNQGPHTDANNSNVLVSKSNGDLTISGIPTGMASSINLSYAKSGQGTLAISTSTENVSVDGNTITVSSTAVSSFDLVFKNTHASKNLRLDDVQVKVATAGSASTTYYLSAPTCAAPTCEDLGTPSVTVTNKTYNSAKLTWAAVDNADKYLVKFNGVDQEATENLYFDATGLEAEETYTYQVKALAEEGQDDWCDGAFSAEANFTTEPAPAATLTLSENTVTHNLAGDHTLGETVTLPSADDCSKKFRGWSVNENCETEPELHAGDSYTLNATSQTLYAVYAKVMSVSDPSLTKLGSGATFADGDKLVIAAKGTKYAIYFENAGSSYVKNWEFAGDDPILTELTDSKKILTLVKSGDNWKFGDAINGYFYSSSSNNLEISTTNSSEFNSFVWNTTEEAFTITKTDNRYLNCRTDLTSTNANLWRFNGTNTNSGSPFLYVYKYSAGDATYGEWSTTCTAPLASPTFSVDPADGPFTSAQSVELSATEGTIYYNINSADDPTSASTPYTGAIDVDACGSTSIKAIAISSTNQSLVASATYVLNLPIPENAENNPYSIATAKSVIDGGCYNNEDVYVTGTVASAQLYNSGTYTVTLEDGFQFYYLYKAAGETPFNSGDETIEAGDVLVAFGKLGMHNTTYQLDHGYLVSRTPAASKTSIANDIDHPYTVAEAIAFCNDPITYDLNDNVYVQGIAAGAPNSNGTFNIYDEGEETTLFQLYKSNLGTYDDIKALDVVTAYGKILKFSTTVYEMNQGAIVAVTPYVAPVVDVTGVELNETAITLKEGLSTTLVATVNPNDASNKNVTWESSNPAVASVANGVVTAETVGTATITVTTEDGGFTATCAVTVIDASARALPNAVFQKVTATGDITDGKYLIVYEGESSLVAFDGALETLDAVGNNIAVTVEGGYIIAPADAAFTIDITARTLKSYSGKYIGVTSNSNGLKQEDASTNYFNTYAIDANENAVITADFSGTTMTLRFNKASNQDRFRYYKNAGQENIQLYKMLEPENVRENLTDGKWGTICPAQTVMLPTGASFYAIAYVEKHGNEPYKVFYDEIAEGESLTAGQPYIFIAEGEAIKGVKVGDAATEGINDHGFIGKVEQYDFQVAAEDVANYRYYMVKDNSIRLCGEGWFRVGAERAYLDMSAGVNTVAHAPAAGRRRVCLTNQEAQVATGMDALNASETPVKMMIDGQLFILRGEKMYNANGQLVK